ncbi:MAG: hypothetical protein A3B90_01625 [Candidatus Magasanikbacteria bacterium RIFCSPHIGHO2_02_FULL_41_13]|uniref:Glycosyltransferase 2-like domain-containing protein n=1 Tax=Candidatus Magasanikbacteria bacterium RIFCSPHIGHO2_02_FULL_41_13 TaxID=1798676 RepID=A0A1F6M6Z2_9BACT|nr:MAG: hypothetical protein A3B90_01625 [Candidatus Magasanikbacteria bacterium RIFCSPHIGHO2_02_FULL_41_13]
MSKLSIHMILHSDQQKKYLPFLFESLKRQTFSDYEFILIDNSSNADVIRVAEDELKKIGCPYKVLDAGGNVGFSAGHNLAYKNSNTAYFLLLNPDMYLNKDVLANMLAFLDVHHDTSNVSVRLMRWDFDHGVEGFTNDVDAIGIRLFRNRRAVEWLTGEAWTQENSSLDVQKIFGKSATEVFGASGAFVMYRRASIEKVLLPGENIFDPTYHSYKEDLDLAYRLRNAGFTSYVILNTVAYHDRTGAGPRNLGDAAAIKNKKTQPYYVSFHSYKNHIRTLYKNEYWQNFLLDFPFILWYELKKFGFLLLTNPKVVIVGWKEIFAYLSYTNKAKKAIRTTRKNHYQGIRRWFLFE